MMIEKKRLTTPLLGAALGFCAIALAQASSHPESVNARRAKPSNGGLPMKAKFNTPDAAARFALAGLQIRVLASSLDTAGALTLLEQTIPPGAGSPLHTVREDKVLVVAEGDVTVRLGAERLRLGSGGTALIPRGTPHRFQNLEATPARILMLILPGGHEVFLSELATLDAKGALTARAMGEVAARHGVKLLEEEKREPTQ
jgi:quercetin dioxygenase-like cupin family protein